VSRRSSWTDAPPHQLASHSHTIWLGDSLGEMPLYYGMSSVALLGGSFAALGGQNLIEAAACGCPVVMGPHTFNFTQAANLAIHAGAAKRADNLNQGVEMAVAIASRANTRQDMSEAATEFAGAHRGAADQTVQAVLLELGLSGVSSA
jgi:3-deoxy-D-manno-octulosonic-acid transferase